MVRLNANDKGKDHSEEVQEWCSDNNMDLSTTISGITADFRRPYNLYCV